MAHLYNEPPLLQENRMHMDRTRGLALRLPMLACCRTSSAFTASCEMRSPLAGAGRGAAVSARFRCSGDQLYPDTRKLECLKSGGHVALRLHPTPQQCGRTFIRHSYPGPLYLFARQALLGGSGCARRQAPAAGGDLPAAITRTQHVVEQADVSVQNASSCAR